MPPDAGSNPPWSIHFFILATAAGIEKHIFADMQKQSRRNCIAFVGACLPWKKSKYPEWGWLTLLEDCRPCAKSARAGMTSWSCVLFPKSPRMLFDTRICTATLPVPWSTCSNKLESGRHSGWVKKRWDADVIFRIANAKCNLSRQVFPVRYHDDDCRDCYFHHHRKWPTSQRSAQKASDTEALERRLKCCFGKVKIIHTIFGHGRFIRRLHRNLSAVLHLGLCLQSDKSVFCACSCSEYLKNTSEKWCMKAYLAESVCKGFKSEQLQVQTSQDTSKWYLRILKESHFNFLSQFQVKLKVFELITRHHQQNLCSLRGQGNRILTFACNLHMPFWAKVQ